MASSYTIVQFGAVAFFARTDDGQRTMLKSSPEWARRDAENERFVCSRWPNCRHRDADACGGFSVQVRKLPRWEPDSAYEPPRWRAGTIDGR